jgi:hypothetical protein
MKLSQKERTHGKDKMSNHKLKKWLCKYEGYLEINFWLAVKQIKTKKKGKILLYTKVSYIHRLLLNIITL